MQTRLIHAAFVSMLAAPPAFAQYCPAGPDFDPPIFTPTGTNAGDFSLGDYNNDGIPDLAVVNEGDGTVLTLLGNGDGTFTPDQSIFTGFDATHAEIEPGDSGFSSFGDLFIAHDDDTLFLYRRNALGFNPPETCFMDGVTTDIARTRWFSPTVTDIIFTVDNATGPDEFWYRTRVLPPSFGLCDNNDSITIATASEPTAVSGADLDGDGASESAIVAGRTNGVVLIHDFDNDFLATSYPVGPEPTALAVGDIDEDGVDDIAVAFDGLDAVRIFLGDGTGGLSLTPIEVPYSTILTDSPKSIIIADFNHDDELDIVLATSSTPGVFYFKGNGTGAFSPPVAITSQLDHTVAAADFNGDGVNDLIVSSPAIPGPSDGVKVYLSNCTLCPADTNGDGIVDPADFTAWVIAFNDGLPQCDQNGDGICDPADFTAWTLNYNDGC